MVLLGGEEDGGELLTQRRGETLMESECEETERRIASSWRPMRRTSEERPERPERPMRTQRDPWERDPQTEDPQEDAMKDPERTHRRPRETHEEDEEETRETHEDPERPRETHEDPERPMRRCRPGYIGPLCKQPDPCQRSPCLNGAACRGHVVGGVPQYTCVCQRGFRGTDPRLVYSSHYNCCPAATKAKLPQRRDDARSRPCLKRASASTHWLVPAANPPVSGHSCECLTRLRLTSQA
ncbi:hypothetical protein CRUP_012865 [Coryphaenoides rupestris]|nr:hypothetical protein CRUP_012865 [Coryphaenoides rupestris]